MRRREFLIGSTAAVTAAMASGKVFAQGAASGANAAKADRIAIMAYSFQRVLKVPGQAAAPEKTLEVFDLGEMFADKYNVHNIEMQHNYFESTDEAFLKSFVARLAKTKSRVSNINLELGNMSISATTPALRAQAVDLTKAWIDHAVILGSPRVMINQGKLTPENRQAAIDTLKQMTAYAKTKNIMVGAEPRNDDFTLLTDVMRSGGGYTNPDVGNFNGGQEEQHAGIRAMFPYTDGNCHMKLLSPAKYDLGEAIQLIKSLGYKGLFSIENERQGDSYANVKETIDVVLANI
jgi:hypothetical protein